MKTELLQWLTPAMLVLFTISFVVLWWRQRQFASALIFASSYLMGAIGFALEITYGKTMQAWPMGMLGDIFYLGALGSFALGLRVKLKIPHPIALSLALVTVAISVTVVLWLVSASLAGRLFWTNATAAMMLAVPLVSARWAKLPALHDVLRVAMFVMAAALLCNGIGAWLSPPLEDASYGGSMYVTILHLVVNVASVTGAALLLASYALLEVRRWRHSSRVDPLTELLNRRGFEDQADRRQAAENCEDEICMWFAIGDLDHFKTLNDTHGHATGDDVLKSVAVALMANTREADIVARFGGEEFVVALFGVDETRAMACIERLRSAIAATVHHDALKAGDVRMTFGLSSWRQNEDMLAVYRDADAALYQGKQDGRDRVVMARREGDRRSDRKLVQAPPIALMPSVDEDRVWARASDEIAP